MVVTYGTLVRKQIPNKQLSLMPASTPKRWVLDGLPPHVAMAAKRLFPSLGKYGKQPFYFPDSKRSASDLNWFLCRYSMMMKASDREYMFEMARRFKRGHAAVEGIMQPDWKPREQAGWRLGKAARHYQHQVVEMMLQSGGVLCGDGVGLGKTFVGLAALLSQGCLPAIVVCDRNLQMQWAKRIRENTTLNPVIIETTRPHGLKPGDCYIFAYTQLYGWMEQWSIIRPRLVIYDEVQDLRTGAGDPTNPIRKGIAAAALSRVADYVVGLSATPIYGFGEEIWNVMSVINPAILGDFEEFKVEWCAGKNLIEPAAMGSFLRDQQVFIRRTKSDVSGQTPPVNKMMIPIEADAATMKEAETLAAALAYTARHGTFHERGQAMRDLDLKLRMATGIAKAPAVASYVQMLLDGGTEKVVVCAWHREVYAILAQRLSTYNPVFYTGSEGTKQKDANVKRFVSGDARVMFISLRSGRGLDELQHACSTMVFAELDWSGQVHEQVIGRLDREGQTNYPVDAFFLVTEDGSDPPMIELNGLKAEQSDGILNPDAKATDVIPQADESRLKALVDRYINRARKLI